MTPVAESKLRPAGSDGWTEKLTPTLASVKTGVSVSSPDAVTKDESVKTKGDGSEHSSTFSELNTPFSHTR